MEIYNFSWFSSSGNILTVLGLIQVECINNHCSAVVNFTQHPKIYKSKQQHRSDL